MSEEYFDQDFTFYIACFADKRVVKEAIYYRKGSGVMLTCTKDTGEWLEEAYNKNRWNNLYNKCGGSASPNWNGLLHIFLNKAFYI